MKSIPVWQNSLKEAQNTLDKVLNDSDFLQKCAQFSDLLTETIKNGGNIFSCGNGGSHCDAMHFAEELTGRYRKDRKPMGAMALGDPSHTTCVSNDFGFAYVFQRQLEGLGRAGDLLLAISTSGNSENICLAVETAKNKGIKTVGLTGKTGGKLKEMVDICLVVPSHATDRIQEIHIKVIHTAIESLERNIFPENYD